MKRNNIQISVVIPFYHREHLLIHTLDSIYKQNLKAFEIIIVNDGSDPQSTKKLHEVTPDDVRIINFKNNSGPGHARNQGVRACVGNWIAFLDSDDLWHPNKLKTQVDYILENPNTVAIHTGIEVNNSNIGVTKKYTYKTSPMTLREILDQSNIVTSSLLIKKSIFEELGGYDESFLTSQDWEFSIRLVAARHKVDFISKSLTVLRRGEEDHHSEKWLLVIKNHTRIIYKHRELYKQVFGSSAIRDYVAKYIRRGSRRGGGIAGYLLNKASYLLSNRLE